MTELALPDLGPRERLAIVRGLSVFPVRHHSPVAARLLVERLRTRPPKAVLIEGPADATAFISILSDPSNEPPLALLSFRAGESKVSYLHPLATFSPEYQAMVESRRLEIPVSFCDVPLAFRDQDDLVELPEGQPAQPLVDAVNLWENEFEVRRLSLDEYLAASLELGRGMRAITPEQGDWTRVREAYMMASASRLVAQGIAPGDILLVCGAAHAGPLVDGDVDLSLLDRLGEPGAVSAFLVPYSYPRLSIALGYGAGVPYPGYSQAIWDAGGEVESATCNVLGDISNHLTALGHKPSLADSIDAFVLAKNLAALRGRAAPGVPELVQAVESCLTRGRFARAREAVHRCLVGDRVGRVAATVGRSPLAVEFYGFVTHARHSPPLVISDRPFAIRLDLHSDAHREISTFLHRTRLAGIPYATAGEDGGTWAEIWRLSWTPGVDHALAAACEIGLSIEEVAVRCVERAMPAVKRVASAAQLFLDVVRAGLSTLVAPAQVLVDQMCLASDDVPDLCGAVSRLHHLVRYEGLTPQLAALVRGLFRNVTTRALLCISNLRQLADTEAAAVAQGLSGFADIREALEPPERALLDGQLEALALSRTVHPLVAGAAAGLALLCERIAMPAVAAEVAGRLCGVGTEQAATWFLEGLFAHQRRELVGTRELVHELKSFVARLPEEEFLRLLPALRRTFGKLERGELALLLTTLASCQMDKKAKARPRASRSVSADREMARALDRLQRELA